MSGPQIMFVCDYCSEHNPEMCGHYDAEDIRLAPNGSWLCESCFDEETPSELGRFSDAPIAYLEAAQSPSPAPGVVGSLWVPAKPDHKKIGWTYDFDQTERLSRAAEKATGYDAVMEVVEFVMAEADRRYKTALASISQPAKGERSEVEDAGAKLAKAMWGIDLVQKGDKA